jgi:hypothetical protein
MMQNFDFFTGMPDRSYNPSYENREIDFLVKNNSSNFINDKDKQKNKVAFMAFVLCTVAIIAFTGGLVVGLKYGGKDKPIIDETTQRSINNLKAKVTSTFESDKEEYIKEKSSFPAGDYPFAIRISGEFDMKNSQNIAEVLSAKGHTVILSKTDSSKYKVFVGPYKTHDEASKILKTLDTNEDTKHLAKMNIIKRS